MLRQFVSLAIGVSILTACAEPAARFDYDTATVEEKQSWLTERAAITAKGIDTQMNNYGGVDHFEVGEPVVNAERGEVSFTIKARSAYKQFETGTSARRKVEAAMCQAYMRSPFQKVSVTNIYYLKQANGAQAHKLKMTTSQCERVLGAT